MNDLFENYPPQDGTHWEAPMWVAVTPAGNGWVRVVDGAHLRRGSGFWVLKFVDQEEVLTLRAGQIAGVDEQGAPLDVRYEDGAALVYVDREYPPAPPPCRIGQVWLITEEGGTAEVEIASIMRFKEGPAVILPSIEPDGTIAHQVIAWSTPPANAIMVRDWDGPKVYIPQKV